jgi:2-oxo-4-hydroxy-4-carboxy-5-ureidoimidazoline decarboxylase
VPVTLEQLNTCDQAFFAASLGHLFEHSPWVASETWAKRPFADVLSLHAALCATMRVATPDRQLALIRAHPDLAGRLAAAGKLTPESKNEQASAGLTQLTADELAGFQKLNEAYTTRFGFPFIICARLNARDAILRAMETRVNNSAAVEFEAALTEIEKIAWLRLNDLLRAS